jgi:prepilin-type processing-associated H-X9-DG protein
MYSDRHEGFSLVGMLFTLACILVLGVILMNSMNTAVTGGGKTTSGSVHSMEDKLVLSRIQQSLIIYSNDDRNQMFPVPSRISGSGDITENTTAALFSVMVMNDYVSTDMLISANEHSEYVWADDDYNRNLPAGMYWDSSFAADLDRLSNTSFAHVPLFDQRLRKQWTATLDSRMPTIGNRGPRLGVPSIDSYACDEDGVWRGHVVFGDGHVEYFTTTSPPNLTYGRSGSQQPDNIFVMEEGERGNDVILSFTLEMTEDGPILQHD